MVLREEEIAKKLSRKKKRLREKGKSTEQVRLEFGDKIEHIGFIKAAQKARSSVLQMDRQSYNVRKDIIN